MKGWNKRILVILLCMVMVMCMLPGIGSAETAGIVQVNTQEEFESAINNASEDPNNPTRINIIGDFECNLDISLASGKYAVIDLQGRHPTINSLRVQGDLTVEDTNGNGEFKNGGNLIVESNGKFTLTGGEIVGVDTGISLNDGSFTMTGGTIKNCTTGIDVGLSGSISISGNPVFTGNTYDIELPEGKKINITGELSNTTAIKVKIEGTTGKGEFTSGYNQHNKGTQPSAYFSSADGYRVYLNDNGEAHIGHFHSWNYTLGTDDTIIAKCNGPETETDKCDITDGLSLTLSAPQDLTYDGKVKAATLNNDYNTTAFPGTYAITYYKDGQIVNAVKDAEDYTAKVTAGTGEGAVTASVDFTISPKSITGAKVVLENDTLEYTSSQQSVSVKSVTLADGTSLAADDYEVSGNTGTDAGPYTLKVTGKGNYTGTATAGWRIGTTSMVVAADDVTAVYDAQSHGITVNVTKPENGAAVKYGTEEGTYDLDESPAITNVSESPSTVYFKVTADNYDDYTGSATVTISPKSIAGATVTLDSTSLEYTGTEQSVSVKSVTLADGTELTAADYDISGNTGTDAGSYTLTVTGKGNYTGTAEAGWTIEEEPEEDTSEPEEEPEEPTEPATEPEEEEPTEPDGEEPTELEEPTDPENPTEPEEPTEPAEDDPVIDPPAPDYHIVFSYPWKTDGGWELYPSGWYYYDVYGRPVTGWLRDGGYWYFLDDTGLMQTGWVYDNWNWYYLYPSGAMATGWVLDGNYWYYLSPYTGAMQTGWLLENGIWYYLNPSGAMVTGDCLVDGIWYSFGADGAWIG